MRGGVVLGFDAATDQAVRALWDVADRVRGDAAHARQLAPHITLLGADNLDRVPFTEGLAALVARTGPFPIHLGAVASFFGPDGVRYLAPSVTPALATLQQQLRDLAVSSGVHPWEQFAPGHWMPHGTLAVGRSDPLILQGVATVRAREAGLSGSGIALVSFTLGDSGARASETLPLTGLAAL